MRRTGRVAVALAISVAMGVVVLAAPGAAMAVNGCRLLTPEELEPIFERPFTLGTSVTGGACEFRRSDDAPRLDLIVVRVLAEKYATVAKAKKEFKEAADLTSELAAAVTPVPNVGDEAFSTYFIGADEMKLRVGKTIVDIRVNNLNDNEARYVEQLVLVGVAAAAHVSSPALLPTTSTTVPEEEPTSTTNAPTTTTTKAKKGG
jgi:hypothetical protein